MRRIKNKFFIFCFIMFSLNIICWLLIGADKLQRKNLINDNYLYYAELGKISGYNPITNNSIFLPQVFALNDEFKDMAKKINNKIWESTLANIPENIAYRGYSCEFAMQSNNYLSIVIRYDTSGDLHMRCDEMSLTLNMETGDGVYLNDLVEINDKFINKLKTYGCIKHEPSFSQENLDKIDNNVLLQRLIMCDEPYTEENYIDKPSFYIQKNRLYFINLFEWTGIGNNWEFYVELDDIEEFLKVKKW